MKKRVLSIFLAIVVLATLVMPVSAAAPPFPTARVTQVIVYPIDKDGYYYSQSHKLVYNFTGGENVDQWLEINIPAQYYNDSNWVRFRAEITYNTGNTSREAYTYSNDSGSQIDGGWSDCTPYQTKTVIYRFNKTSLNRSYPSVYYALRFQNSSGKDKSDLKICDVTFYKP